MRLGFCAWNGTAYTRELIRLHDEDERIGKLPQDIREIDRWEFPELIRQTYDELTLPFDGALSVARLVENLDSSLSDKMDEAGIAAYWAGMILGVVYQMDQFHRDELRGGASVGKAIDLLEESGGPANSVLWKHWASHKSIAHLAQAAIVVHDCFSRDGLLAKEREDEPTIFGVVLSYTPDVLNLARFFQEFGLNFVAKASKSGPLLNPETTWRMPVSVPFKADLFKSAPLTERELEFLRGRRAKRAL